MLHPVYHLYQVCNATIIA